MLTLSFAPHTRTADAAVIAPRKNLRVFGSDTAKLLFAPIVSRAESECFRYDLANPQCQGFLYDTRQITFPPSSDTSMLPSFNCRRPTGRPHTSFLSDPNDQPLAKSRT